MEDFKFPAGPQAGQTPGVSTLGPAGERAAGEGAAGGPAPQPGEPSEGAMDFIASIETMHSTAPPAPRPQPDAAPPSYDAPSYDAPSYDAPAPRFGMVVPAWVARPAGGESPWAALDALLAGPFSRRLVLGVAIAPFAAVLAGFIIQAAIFGGDWAHGGVAAGVDALLLAVAAGIGWARRYQLGRRGQTTSMLAGALVGALLLTGLANLLLAPQFHYVQGRTLEATGRYADAIAQYKAYGEKAPDAADIARADIAWGERFLAAKQYAEASQRLGEAVTIYKHDDALGRQANKDLYLTFSAWLTAGGVGLPYGDAAAQFAAYRASKACDPDCQTAAGALEAQARILAGKQLVAVGDLKNAVAQFDLVQSQFPGSQYAGTAHTDGAAAYLAYGQAQLKAPATCRNEPTDATDASSPYGQLLTTFQTLATKYGDTPQGAQAAGMLSAPVSVTGAVSGVPNNPAPLIRLATSINPDKQQFPFNYSTNIDPSTGAYAFGSVAQGDYNLYTARDLGNKVDFHILRDKAGNLYNVHAGPLCTVQLNFAY